MAVRTGRTAPWRNVTGIAIALVAGACSTTAGPTPVPALMSFQLESGTGVPCPSVAPDALGYVCMEFDGHVYRGVGVQETPERQSGARSLTITRDLLSKIGTATSVNADIGTNDWSVYEIAGVDPAAAVAMYTGSGQAFLDVWTKDGVSPALIPGLCEHFLDPSLRLCLATPQLTMAPSGAP